MGILKVKTRITNFQLHITFSGIIYEIGFNAHRPYSYLKLGFCYPRTSGNIKRAAAKVITADLKCSELTNLLLMFNDLKFTIQ